MSYQIIKTRDGENWIKLTGKLNVSEFQDLQDLGRLSLERFGQVRILFELEDFQGWSKEPGWADSFFLEENSDSVSRLAFVGDETWRDEIFMFTGKPMRKIPIEFFHKDQLAQAKAWLSEENPQSIFLD